MFDSDTKMEARLMSVKANEQKSLFVKVSHMKAAPLQDKDQSKVKQCFISQGLK